MIRNLLVTTALAACAAYSQNPSGLAVGLLDHANQAREAVQRRDRDGALNHIKQALANADALQADSTQPRPVMAAVSKDVEKTTTYTPLKPNKQMTAARLKHDTSIREVEANVDTAMLDVTSSAERLRSAQAAVQQQDWTTADTALTAIPNSIIRKHVEGDMPLMKVRENLNLARARVLEGKYNDAKAPLRAAAQALADYEKLSPGPHSERAASMRQAMEEFANHVPHNQDEATTKIDLWLDPVNSWYNEVVKK